MRNEDEPAPITIEARSAVEPGTAASRMRSTSRREPRCADTAAGGSIPPR